MGAFAHVSHVNAALGRFTLVRRIGEGAFGVVFEADDPHYRCRVALKVLRGDRVVALHRFKLEFRTLADLAHPNLVKLYELSTDGDTWYFTMELVEGRTFLEYTSGSLSETATATDTGALFGPRAEARALRTSSVDVARLYAACRELAGAVHTLHAGRKLHCDLKPSNVLVTKDGRVVVLDFGLVTDIDDEDTTLDRPLGTPGYMSPEQAARKTVTPASDWYSFGAMLHEALTGSLPHSARHQLSEVATSPELAELTSLCADLLKLDPAARPSADEILRRLGGEALPSSSARPIGTSRAFFGRRGELSRLHDARREVSSGRAVVVRIVGGSGMGKTALAERFLDELQRAEPEALVLRGRSYEQESVPYKALDGITDALGRHLGALSQSELDSLTPKHAERLARLFRIFERVPFKGAAPDSGAAMLDEHAQRREAFVALRDLLASVAERQPLVLLLDDLHWGDVDSARLLAELLRPPSAPRMLLVATQRPDSSSHAFIAALEEALTDVVHRVIELGELSAEEARSMAEHLLGGTLHELAEPVAREGAGHPIFIQHLAERALVSGDTPSSSFSLGHVIMDRIRELDVDARRLLEVVAIAGQPISENVVIQAAGLAGAVALKARSTARSARLLSIRSASTTLALELAHDRVREAITEAMADDAQRSAHGRLARALVANGYVDPELLVQHYERAGDPVSTRKYGEAAAVRAENAYAFDRAAHYYSIVLGLTDEAATERWKLLERYATALANAGRGGEAGDVFQRAADVLGAREPDHAEVVTLSRRAGEHALRSGRIDVGTHRMNAVLARVGVSMPRSRATASALSAMRRARLFVRGMAPKPATNPTRPRDRARLDALWAASTGLSMVNHVVADALGLAHLLEALEVGDLSAVVRGLGYEAAFEAVIGGPILQRRCRTILSMMDDLARRSRAPYDHAWARMSRGVVSWFLGDWNAAWSHCDEASVLYANRGRGVAWELAICNAYGLPALAYLGHLSRLAEVVPRALEGARERGDLFAASTLRLGQQSLVLLVKNRPEDAIEEANRAIRTFPNDVYLLPHYHHLFAVAQAELYRARPLQAWRRIEESAAGLRQSRLLMVQCLGVEIRHLRARAALALAGSSDRVRGRSPKALRKMALAEANAIERSRAKPASPFAASIRAAVANAAGDRAAAIAHLTRALFGFQSANMHLYAQATRDRLGALRGGAEGAKLRAEAARWMAEESVEEPAALIAMLIPGV